MSKSIVVTGATSGVGKALCLALLQANNEVIALGRNPQKLNALEREAGDYKQNLHLYRADFNDLSNVRSVTNTIIETFDSGIDVLINNAATVPKKRTLSQDNIEMQFQVNHLVPFMMSDMLVSLLEKKEGIIITTSSNAHKKAKFDANDLEVEKKYHVLRAYARTKLYNIMFTLSFNEYHKSKNVKAYAVHPGVVNTSIGTKDTSKLYAFLWRWYTKRGISPKEASQTFIDIINKKITTNDAIYFYQSSNHDYAAEKFSYQDREMLWDYSLNKIKENSAE